MICVGIRFDCATAVHCFVLRGESPLIRRFTAPAVASCFWNDCVAFVLAMVELRRLRPAADAILETHCFRGGSTVVPDVDGSTHWCLSICLPAEAVVIERNGVLYRLYQHSKHVYTKFRSHIRVLVSSDPGPRPLSFEHGAHGGALAVLVRQMDGLLFDWRTVSQFRPI